MSARQAFHNAQPDRLVGRDKERCKIANFINDKIKLKRPGSMYVGGAPGTGKTSVLSQIMKESKVIYILTPFHSYFVVPNIIL